MIKAFCRNNKVFCKNEVDILRNCLCFKVYETTEKLWNVVLGGGGVCYIGAVEVELL